MTKSEEMSRLVSGVIGAMVVSTFFAVAGIYINKVSDAPCSLENRIAPYEVQSKCTERNPCACHQGPCMINPCMKVPLIATHLLAFALFPFAMYVYWSSTPKLKAKSTFSSVLGFAFLMVAICGEIGWHVSQRWFYQEEYHILNFVFYFFFMAGVAFWANGISLEPHVSEGGIWDLLDKLSGLANMLLFISPLVVTLVYGGGATIKVICSQPEVCPGWVSALASKVPIYILMAVEFAVLSIRLYRLLDGDWRVVFLPLFSVGVNLFFIFMLNGNVNDSTLNPLYHTLHDLLGTELGVFIAALLVWNRANPHYERRKKSE